MNARFGALLLFSTVLTAIPAASIAEKAAKSEEQAAVKQPQISSGASKAIQALDKAVKAKEAAAIPALLAAAKASAKTADDRFVVAQLALSVALEAQDKAAIIAALQETVDSGFLPPKDLFQFYLNLGRLQYDAKNYAAAAAALEKAMEIRPNDVDTLAALSDSYSQLKRPQDSLTVLRKAIELRAAAGTKADESWYRRAAALAFNNKLPNFMDMALDWVTAYPSKTSWSDALRIFQQANQMDPVASLDISRLLFAVGAMQSENDYYRYASAASTKGFPGEAKLVLESGFAAGTVSKNSAALAPLYASASAKAKGDRESLAAAAKTAIAAPAAKQATVIGDAYYGYGDYAQAIELYKAALGKTGADKDLINLHLGMALTRSGDRVGAKAALESVRGVQSAIAKFWLIYLSVSS